MATAAAVRTRKKKPASGPLVLGLLVLGAGLLALGTLHYMGQIRLPFLPAPSAAAEDHTGEVPVPLCAVPVAVFHRVELKNLVDPKTGQVKVKWMPEAEAAAKDYVLKVPEILGRVMRHDKTGPYAFKETDFYPPGSIPSPELGVAPGQHGVRIDPERVAGIGLLERGLHFKILSTVSDSNSDARQEMVVNDGVVVLPGSKNKAASKEEKQPFVQVSPRELSALNKALANERAKLICVAGAAPAFDPEPPAEVIEVLTSKGSRKDSIPVAEPKKEDADPKQKEDARQKQE